MVVRVVICGGQHWCSGGRAGSTVRCVVAEVFGGVLQGLAVFGLPAVREDQRRSDWPRMSVACSPRQRQPNEGSSCGRVMTIGVVLRCPTRYATLWVSATGHGGGDGLCSGATTLF
uniref:Uncharacterized protein n=1 Tax=Arundo donax TaxID=35708 RepID=A0A0A9C1U1_ARUDO